MFETRRILAVTDLGPAGREAVRAAATRAQEVGATLAVVHAMPVLDMTRPIFPQQVAVDAMRAAELPQKIRHALDAQVKAALPEGLTAEIFLESGNPSEAALAVADRWDADLLVTGAPEAGALDAGRLVRHAHVPVLIARGGPARGAVVACTDFSDPSLPAVHAGAAEARRTGDDFHVLHALEPIPAAMLGVEGYGIVPSAEWQMARRTDAEQRLAAALAAVGTRGSYVAVDGAAVPAIVKAVEERAARLLVIGTVGRTGLTRFLLGSVAEALVDEASCSTLVVRLRRG